TDWIRAWWGSGTPRPEASTRANTTRAVSRESPQRRAHHRQDRRMRAPDRGHSLPRPAGDDRVRVVDQEDRGCLRGYTPRDEAARLDGRFARDPQLECRALPGAAPGGQRRTQQLRGEHALHPLPRPGDELHDQIGRRAGPGDRPNLGLDGLARVPQGLAQAVERLALLGGELGDECPGIDGAVARRSTGEADRGGAPGKAFERAIGVGPCDARGVGKRIARGGSQPEQSAVYLRLGGSEAKRGKIDGACHLSSSICYYCAFPLDNLDRNPNQPGDQPQPEGGVGLPLRGTLAGSFEREVVCRQRTRRFGHGAQALRTPDAPVVALTEQSRQHAVRARDLAYKPEPRQQLEPIERERNVRHVALGVRVQRITEQLEHGLQVLAAGEHKEGPARRR